MHKKTTWNERLFASKHTHWFNWYLSEEGVVNYAINLFLYINTLKEKYNKMYEKHIHRLQMYANAIRILSNVNYQFHFYSNKIKRNSRGG